MRNRLNTKTVSLLIIVALAPGCLTLLYSQTFIHVGIGATHWWWDYHIYPPEVSLSVSNSSPTATEIIHGEQLRITSFNITGGNVTIIVSCERNGTITTYDSITGEYDAYLIFPTAEPTGRLSQVFNVTVSLEDNNATVSFDYYIFAAWHADGSVTFISPGYEEIRVLGENLMIFGLVISGIIVALSLVVIGKKRMKNW